MDIHIGSLIKSRAKELRIGPTELGAKINTSKQNVYGIYKRESIDTGLLQKLSQALDFDFYRYYSDILQVDNAPNGDVKCAECAQESTQLKSKIEELKKENTLLNKINSLLEDKMRTEKD